METENERRGPGRPRREGSEIRSEELRSGIRERKRKGAYAIDKFHIDPSTIPAGTSYEWKRISTLGASDPYYEVEMREQGWEPVEASRHPELVAKGSTGAIVRDGLMLMERPIELTREAQQENIDRANDVVRTMKQKLGESPKGTLPREAPNLQNYHRTSYEAMPIDG